MPTSIPQPAEAPRSRGGLARNLSDTTKGVLCAVVAALGFAWMGYCVHAASDSISGASLAFWRGLVSCLLLAPLLRNDLAKLFRAGSGWLWMRSVAGAGSVLCFFTTLQQTGLAAARALADMAPVFVCILAWLRGTERPTIAQSLVIVAMTAAAVSLDLGAVAALSGVTVVIGLFGAFSASLAYVALRRAAQRFSNNLVVFALGVGMMSISPFTPGFVLERPSAAAWLPIAGVGILGVVAQVIFTRVFRFVSAPIASALSVIALVFSVGIDIVFVGNMPTAFALACYGAILCGAAALHILELRRLRSDDDGVASQPID